MRIVRLSTIKRFVKHGTVLSIGNLDGIHKGHQAILEMLKLKARALGLPSVIMTFEPYPQEYFRGIAAPARLTNFQEKVLFLKTTGIDFLLCIPFNQTFSSLSPLQFIEEILVNDLHIKYLLIGDDFRFGHLRVGDKLFLEQYSTQYGYQIEQAPTLCWHRKKISSTWVRELLACGNFKKAASLLGRPYSMIGRVVSGDGRGKAIGFPTANICPKRMVLPFQGVFVVRVYIQNTAYYGVANLGTRPTIGHGQVFLEVHVLNFKGNLYGTLLKIEFLHKLRDEQRFASINDLKHQIEQDVLVARKLLGCN